MHTRTDKIITLTSITNNTMNSPNTPKNISVKPNKIETSLTSHAHSFFRKRVYKQLAQIKGALITIKDPLGSKTFGQQASDSLSAIITFNDTDCYRDIALGGSNGAAEAYLQGRWNADNLTQAIRVFARNRQLVDKMEGGFANVAKYFMRIWHSNNKNTKAGSKRNIAAHYDLGNDFFRTFLDKKMMYSSYLYDSSEDFEEASTRKLQRICEQLKINNDSDVVEIGTGWGGFAIYAAQSTGCKITTITISQEQYQETQNRVKTLQLQDLVSVKLCDYRDLKGTYDKLVSIEMIEAVGHHYLDDYFDTVSRLLKPHGEALIQAITVEDHRYEISRKEVDYIKRYIFPGGFLPSISKMTDKAGKHRLVMENLFDMGLSYAKTLQHWRERFFQKVDIIRKQGFDERFIRMWEYYLCYCEAGFSERAISVVQAHYRKSI